MERHSGSGLQYSLGASGYQLIFGRLYGDGGCGNLADLLPSLFGGGEELQIPGDPADVFPQLPCGPDAAGMVCGPGSLAASLNSEGDLQ